MGVLKQLWKNRALLMEVLQGVRRAFEGGGTLLEIRNRIADGVQKGDIISDDALRKFKSANKRAQSYIDGGT